MFPSPSCKTAKARILCPILFYCFCTILSAQKNDTTFTEESDLRIYIDCETYDLSYYSENFSMVQFITYPGEADVFVSVNEEITGYGYTWTNMVFYGKKRFILLRNTLEFLQSSDVSLDDKRMMQLEKIKLGLVPYLLKTPDASRLFVMVDQEDLEESIKKDPWKHWAFSISGMGSFFQQENYRSLSGFFSLYITRITDKFKFESQNMLSLMETSMELIDPVDSTPLKYKTFQRGWSSNTLAVKSLGSHAGLQSKWGSVTTTLTGSSYVNYPSRYSVNTDFMTTVYVPFIKGLSLNVMGGMSTYRDRINQTGMGSSQEDLLIYQQSIERDYRIYLSFGITCRFGSRTFPALNVRFSQ